MSASSSTHGCPCCLVLTCKTNQDSDALPLSPGDVPENPAFRNHCTRNQLRQWPWPALLVTELRAGTREKGAGAMLAMCPQAHLSTGLGGHFCASSLGALAQSHALRHGDQMVSIPRLLGTGVHSMWSPVGGMELRGSRARPHTCGVMPGHLLPCRPCGLG